MNKHIFSCLLLFLGLFLCAKSASASGITYTWTGAGDGVTWTDINNWDQGAGYPGTASTDIADFDGNGAGWSFYVDPGSSSNPVIIPSSTPITIAQLQIASNNVTVYLNTNGNVLTSSIILLTYTLNLSATSIITMAAGTGTGAGLNDVFVNAGNLNATGTTFNFNTYSYLYNAGTLTTTTCTFNFSGLDAEFVTDGGSSTVTDAGSSFNFTGNNDGSLYSITVYVSKVVGGYPLKNGGSKFITGSSTLTFSGTYTSSGTPYALFNSATFVLDSRSVLNLNSASSTVFNLAGQIFALLSDANGTATVGPCAHGSGTFGGTGNYYVQRYITAQAATPGPGYRLLTAPVYSQFATGGAGTSNIPLTYLNITSLSINGTTYKGAYAGSPSPGTGFNSSTAYNPSLYIYDEAISPVTGGNANFTNGKSVGVTAMANASGNPGSEGYTNSIIGAGTAHIQIGTGFLFYYVGNTSSFSTARNTAIPATTISWFGKPGSGTIPFYNWVTNTAGLSYTSGATSNKGINLLGNPYPSAIDLFQVGADNYAYGAGTPTTMNFYELGDDGNYVTETYNAGSGGFLTTSGPSGNANDYRYIAEGQGFFVQATKATQTFNFQEGEKTTTPTTTVTPLTAVFLANRGNQKLTEGSTEALSPTAAGTTASATTGTNRALINTGLASIHVALQNSNAALKSCGIYFQPSSPDTFNANDALDLDGINPVIYMSSFTSDGSRVAINTLGDYTKTGKNVKLFVNGTVSGTYTLNLTNIANIDQTAFNVWLVDNYKKDTVDFASNKSYTFSIDTGNTSTFGSNRFAISILRKPLVYRLLSFAGSKDNTSVTLTWKAKNEGDFTGFSVQKLDPISNQYNTLNTLQSDGSGSYSFVDKSPATGFNTYRLAQNNIDNVTSYSGDLRVNFNFTQLGALSVYPNPAKDVVTVNFNNVNALTSDIYNVNIYNSMGVLIMQKSISANTVSQDVSALKPGAYIIEVRTNYGNSIGNAKFLKN